MVVVIPNIKNIVLAQMRWMIIGAIFFTLMIISAFYITVNALLRQKKLSEIKNDFINLNLPFYYLLPHSLESNGGTCTSMRLKMISDF